MIQLVNPAGDAENLYYKTLDLLFGSPVFITTPAVNVCSWWGCHGTQNRGTQRQFSEKYLFGGRLRIST